MKAVVFDIDDILADYTGSFLDYVNAETGRAFRDIIDAKKGLGRIKYWEVKDRYRASGIKRDLRLLNSSAPKLISRLKEKGFEIAMVSSRPVEEHSRIYNDTFIWLIEQGFEFDHLLFSRQKHLLIFRNFREYDEVYVIEDDFFYVEKMAACSLKVFWVATEEKRKGRVILPYNVKWVNLLDNPMKRIVDDILEETNDSKTY